MVMSGEGVLHRLQDRRDLRPLRLRPRLRLGLAVFGLALHRGRHVPPSAARALEWGRVMLRLVLGLRRLPWAPAQTGRGRTGGDTRPVPVRPGSRSCAKTPARLPASPWAWKEREGRLPPFDNAALNSHEPIISHPLMLAVLIHDPRPVFGRDFAEIVAVLSRQLAGFLFGGLVKLALIVQSGTYFICYLRIITRIFFNNMIYL